MRRLWAYILLAVTSLVLIGVGFVPLMRNVNSNMDYQPGREIVFHVESKSENTEGNKSLTNEQLDELADMMSDRLTKQGVNRYEINIQGDDTIAITLSEDSESQYTSIIQYMEFDGSFALTNSAGVYALADEFLIDGGKASLETYKDYPCITLPVNVEGEKYKEVLEGAKGEGAKAETSGEGEEQVSTYYLYLWYGFEEKFISSETDYANDEHVIMKFRVADSANDEDQYFPNTDNKLYSMLNLDGNGDGTATYSEKKAAFDMANFYVNLLNASKLEVSGANGQKIDVVVKNIGSNYVDAKVEQIIALGNVDSLAIGPTFIATICAIVLVSLLLVYFYKLGAVAVIVTTLGSLFAGLASMVLLTAEFTTVSIFAFIALAIASLASGIIHLQKIKDEAYRGRSLKKANTEGGKKSLLPILDVNVVLVIIGVFAYLLGGSAMRTFGAITVLGGVASLILNVLVLRLLLWLPTNATCLQGKYGFFGIDGNKVPDLMNEEKQVYYGPYADKDLTKNKVKVGIPGAILLAATTVAMIVFGILNGGIYADKKDSYSDRVYFETTMTENSQINDASIKDILNKTFVYQDDGNDELSDSEKESAKSLASLGINRIDTTGKQYVITDDNDEDTTYHVSVVYLNGSVKSSYSAFYKVDDNTFISINPDGDKDVNSIINYAIDRTAVIENVAKVSVKQVSVYKVGQPNVLYIALAALAGAGVAGLYLLIRYRLSRGLVATCLAIASGSIALGLLSLVHLPVIGGYTAVIAPLTALFTFIIAIMFMNKERELVLDDKSKDTSLEARIPISVKATSLSYSMVAIVSIVAALIGITFFGFGPADSALSFIALIIALLAVLIVVPVVIAPLSNLLYGWFSKVNIKKPSRKKKTKVAKTTKSAEPEEAIFIGIND